MQVTERIYIFCLFFDKDLSDFSNTPGFILLPMYLISLVKYN